MTNEQLEKQKRKRILEIDWQGAEKNTGAEWNDTDVSHQIGRAIDKTAKRVFRDLAHSTCVVGLSWEGLILRGESKTLGEATFYKPLVLLNAVHDLICSLKEFPSESPDRKGFVDVLRHERSKLQAAYRVLDRAIRKEEGLL